MSCELVARKHVKVESHAVVHTSCSCPPLCDPRVLEQLPLRWILCTPAPQVAEHPTMVSAQRTPLPIPDGDLTGGIWIMIEGYRLRDREAFRETQCGASDPGL
jgi:hypothetical protein